jgi:hypothetical protein
MAKEECNHSHNKLHRHQSSTPMMSGQELTALLQEMLILLLKEVSQPHGSKQEVKTWFKMMLWISQMLSTMGESTLM